MPHLRRPAMALLGVLAVGGAAFGVYLAQPQEPSGPAPVPAPVVAAAAEPGSAPARPRPGASSPWARIGETRDMALWMDRSSMAREADVRRAWEIQDLKAPDADGVRSRRYLNEYDCKHRMHRIGNVTSFSGPMLTGRQLFEVDEMGYWRKVPTRGLFAVGFVIHCEADPREPGGR